MNPKRKVTRRVRARVRVEALEDRQLLSTVVSLTEDGRLLRIDSDRPDVVLGAAAVSGLQGGESLLGIDVRPATGELYGLGSTGRLYVVDPITGAATLRAALAADPTDTTDPFTTLNGTIFGIDFNPVADRLRVVSDTDINLRINPTSGLVFTDTTLAFAPTDPLSGVNPIVTDIAYTNNVPTATSTTLIGIEGMDPILHSTKLLPDGTTVPAMTVVRQGGVGVPPGTPSPNTGQLFSIGAFGRNGAILRGFDIAPSGAAITAVELRFADGSVSFALVLVNPASGADQALGRIGDGITAIRDIAVVPSVQFTARLYATAEDAGAVVLTVMRTDDGTGPVSVDFTTVDGSALAGADYGTVAGRLDFAAGEVAKTITVPIVNDPGPEGDEFFNIVLSRPAGGTVILGAPNVALVRINPNDATDRRGPQVTSVLETGPSRGITGFTVQFDEDMDPIRATNLANYRLVGIGRGGRRTPIALGAAVYDPAARTVKVTASQAFMQTQFRQLEFRINGRRNGLTDLAGNRLDGDRNGRPGGNAVFRFAIFSGTTITFRDKDGDRATLSIANGGTLDGIRPLSGPATQRTQFWILDPIAIRSTLSGTVQRSRRGDGIIVIAEIIGLDKKEFTPLLSNTAFRVNTLTFSSNATGIG